MLKKNDNITLEITDITNEGNGVGHYNGIAVFVPMTAVGDVINCHIVKVNKSYCYGIIKEIVKPSQNRIENDCPAYKKCGGCSFRHFSYEEECRIKSKFIIDAFHRIGGLSPNFEAFQGAENISGYRNKAQFPVSMQDGRTVCGFYAKRTHNVCGYYQCDLQPPVFADIIADIMEYVDRSGIKAYDELTGRGLLRHVYLRKGEHSGEIMLCFVLTDIDKLYNFTRFVDNIVLKHPEIKSIVINENRKNGNKILGDKTITLYGNNNIYDIMSKNNISISPLSFYQINTSQAERLYNKAEEYADLDADSTLLDLYCGAGTIGLSMAKDVKKLIGVEIIPQAIENAKLNATINGYDNCEFICGDAGKIAKILFERGERPDVIVADPARKGCTRDTLEYMKMMSPDRIVMISCNPATAARDCAILGEFGYSAVKVTGFDLFPRTTHVECVIQLVKK